MSSYLLFVYLSNKWLDTKAKLEAKLNSLDDIKALISSFLTKSEDEVDFKTLDILAKENVDKVVHIFDKARLYSLRLPEFFSDGKIARLNDLNNKVELTRRQVLCLLCHMLFCTLKRTRQNFYWVTFENWLTDGRCCAIAYLSSLLEYFRQTFDHETSDYMNELVRFRRNSATLGQVIERLGDNSFQSDQLILHLHGSIGDGANAAEVDFANCDIGYGITGTQEEMLFGASSELCVAMLFCDTMQAHEAIAITGARKIAKFNGYGLDVTVDSYLQFDRQAWKDRTIIAIDALDLSDEPERAFVRQLLTENLNRELVKACAGFSLASGIAISTGHWGCGAFGGDKELKFLIQLLAASASGHRLIFYCRGNEEFHKGVSEFLGKLNDSNVSTLALWKLILQIENDLVNLEETTIFDYLKRKL